MLDCELPEFANAADVRARKDHKCCECRATIRRGERYTRCSGKWDGQVSTYKQHDLCARACEFYRDNIGEDCLPFGSLFEWWRDDGKRNDKRDENYAEIRVMLAGILKRKRAEAGCRSRA